MYSRPLPSEKKKTEKPGVSVGEGATVHRLQTDDPFSSSSVKTANNKIPVSSVFNGNEGLYGTTVSRFALSVGLIISLG